MKPDGKPDFKSLTECLDAAQAAINGMSSPAFTYRSGTEAIEQAQATLAEMRAYLYRLKGNAWNITDEYTKRVMEENIAIVLNLIAGEEN